MRSIPLRGFDQAYLNKKNTTACVSSYCILLYVRPHTDSAARLRPGIPYQKKQLQYVYPHTAYWYMCVLILIPLRGFDQAYFNKKHTTVCVSSYCILLYVCPHAESAARLRPDIFYPKKQYCTCVLILHTAICVSSYWFRCAASTRHTLTKKHYSKCVLILHTAICVSAYWFRCAASTTHTLTKKHYCMCVLILHTAVCVSSCWIRCVARAGVRC